MEFVGDHTVLQISKNGREIIYDCRRIPVTTVSVFNEKEGKLETREYIIKFSKKQLFVYDKETRQLVSEFKFNCFKTVTMGTSLGPGTGENGGSHGGEHGGGEVPNGDASGSGDGGVSGSLLLRTFVLREGISIYLCVDNTDSGEVYYITTTVSPRENVVSVVQVGSSKEYTTSRGNVLSVGSARPSTWNGVPLGVR